MNNSLSRTGFDLLLFYSRSRSWCRIICFMYWIILIGLLSIWWISIWSWFGIVWIRNIIIVRYRLLWTRSHRLTWNSFRYNRHFYLQYSLQFHSITMCKSVCVSFFLSSPLYCCHNKYIYMYVYGYIWFFIIDEKKKKKKLRQFSFLFHSLIFFHSFGEILRNNMRKK